MCEHGEHVQHSFKSYKCEIWKEAKVNDREHKSNSLLQGTDECSTICSWNAVLYSQVVVPLDFSDEAGSVQVLDIRYVSVNYIYEIM